MSAPQSPNDLPNQKNHISLPGIGVLIGRFVCVLIVLDFVIAFVTSIS